MLEFLDKGNINLSLKKRELDVSCRMDSEKASRKRNGHEFLTNDEFVKKTKVHNSTASSFDQKRRRFSEDSTNMNKNIEEGYFDNHISLDLELNLSPSLVDLKHRHDHHDMSNYNKNYDEDERKKKIMEKGSVFGLQTQKSMSWVAFDLDDNGGNRGGARGGDSGGGGGREEEMVAKVCMKCHMLVMLCKASPVCPNCKFMHSPEETSLSLLFTPKPTLLT